MKALLALSFAVTPGADGKIDEPTAVAAAKDFAAGSDNDLVSAGDVAMRNGESLRIGFNGGVNFGAGELRATWLGRVFR